MIKFNDADEILYDNEAPVQDKVEVWEIWKNGRLVEIYFPPEAHVQPKGNHDTRIQE